MNAANSTSPIVDKVNFPQIPGPPPDIAVGSIAYRLLQQREAVQDLRFALDEDIHNLVTANWQRYRSKLRAWFCKVNSTLAELQDTGRLEAATWLENYLAISPSLSDPNNFKSMVQTGFGTHAVIFLGEDKSRSADDRAGPHDLALCNANLAPLRLPKPVQLGSWNRGSMFSGTISLRDAIAGKLWISFLPTGIAFCVRCPCADLISPRRCLAELSQDLCRGRSYEFVPRQFHTDPLEDDLALRHFSTCHSVNFPSGVGGMLETYGLRVQPTESDVLDPWFIAAHNMAATAWRAEAMSSWLAQISSRGTPQTNWSRGYRSRSRAAANRHIDHSLLCDTFVFSRPLRDAVNGTLNTTQWAVFCTFPDCCNPGFSEHPFQEKRAFKHFASHGLMLINEREVMDKFGFRVQSENIITLGEPSILKRRRARNETTKNALYDRIVKYPTLDLTSKCRRHGIDPAGLSRSSMVQQLIAKLDVNMDVIASGKRLATRQTTPRHGV